MNRRRHEGAAPAEAAKACRNDGLTGKQRLFVTEYLIDLNGTQAAIRAGYSRESARSIACENLTKPDIAEAIDRALAERPGITRTRIVDELAKIGFSDIRRVVSWRSETVTAEPSEGDEGEGTNAIVSRVTVLDSGTIDPDAAAAVAQVSQSATGAVQVKMHDKGAALERLARALGMFKDRVDMTYDGKPVAPVINWIGCPQPNAASQAVGRVRKASTLPRNRGRV